MITSTLSEFHDAKIHNFSDFVKIFSNNFFCVSIFYYFCIVVSQLVEQQDILKKDVELTFYLRRIESRKFNPASR